MPRIMRQNFTRSEGLRRPERQALESQTKTKQHPNDDDERPLLLLLLPQQHLFDIIILLLLKLLLLLYSKKIEILNRIIYS